MPFRVQRAASVRAARRQEQDPAQRHEHAEGLPLQEAEDPFRAMQHVEAQEWALVRQATRVAVKDPEAPGPEVPGRRRRKGEDGRAD